MSEINNIKSTGNANINTVRNTSGGDKRATDTQPVQQDVATDKVSLTDQAAQLQTLKQAVEGVSSVDSNRVEALKAAIEDGSYKVDSQKLAQNMIDLERQLS